MGHKNQLLKKEESFLTLLIKMHLKIKDPKFIHFSDILTGDQISAFEIFHSQNHFTTLICLPPN